MSRHVRCHHDFHQGCSAHPAHGGRDAHGSGHTRVQPSSVLATAAIHTVAAHLARGRERHDALGPGLASGSGRVLSTLASRPRGRGFARPAFAAQPPCVPSAAWPAPPSPSSPARSLLDAELAHCHLELPRPPPRTLAITHAYTHVVCNARTDAQECRIRTRLASKNS